MKYCRFEIDAGTGYGLVEEVDGAEHITRLIETPRGAPPVTMEHAGGVEIPPLPLATTKLLTPVAPSKIVCVGRNYREHAAELGNEVPIELLIFLKPPSSIIGPHEAIRRPRISERVDHEAELGVVIGRQCSRLADNEAVRPYILGYTCVNDVTARDLQKKDGQWTRGKGFDTFCPVGPVVSTDPDPWAGVAVEARVNGEVRQHGNTRDFVFPLEYVIQYISRVMTLYPGDLIATGTPSGVGPLKTGDLVEVTVEGVGTLTNVVVDE
jgi:2-keto-4-pentenoate hydratase/2-oxohepta-3-ene-1,7-dioic acid hydratase in catechol pathway